MPSPESADTSSQPAAPDDALLARVVASRIARVTVFRTGALVERVASLDPSEVPATIRFTGLPLSLYDPSVRARVEVDSEPAAAETDPLEPPVRVSDLRIALEVPEPDRELAPPRDEELREALRDVRRLEGKISSAEGMIGRLETLAAPQRPRGAYGSPPPSSPAAGRLALLDFRGAELERLDQRLADLRGSLEAAVERVRQLEDQARRASTARQARENELRKSLLVKLRREADGSGGTPCRIVVCYLVPGARWTPGYTVRFDSGLERVDLALRTMVCQATGEDWKGVRLTLSTAKPQRWSELPELKSLRIGKQQPPTPPTGWREPPAGTAALFADYDRANSRDKPQKKRRQQKKQPSRARPAPPAAMLAAAPEPNLEADVAAAAVPVMAKMRRSDTRSIDLEAPDEAMLSVALAGGAPRSRAPERKVMAKRGAPPKQRRRPAPEAPAPPEPDPGIAAPEKFLDYGRLRMAGAEEPKRGTLHPVGGEEEYLELLVALRVEVRFDVTMAIRRATQKASKAGKLPAPPGYAYPRAWRGFDHAYVAESAVDVASDGVFHNLPLLTRQGEARVSYVAVPRETPQAFRVARFDNPLVAPLPRGPADIYVGEDFLLTSTIDPTAPGGSVELGLGVDEALKVARNTRFKEETSGLIASRLRLKHEVDVEVANRLGRPVRCEIRERLPAPREGDDTIEVEVVRVEPAWQPFEQPQSPVAGSHRWRLTLDAGESRTLKLEYVIRLPAKNELVGGNRREP